MLDVRGWLIALGQELWPEVYGLQGGPTGARSQLTVPPSLTFKCGWRVTIFSRMSLLAIRPSVDRCTRRGNRPINKQMETRNEGKIIINHQHHSC